MHIQDEIATLFFLQKNALISEIVQTVLLTKTKGNFVIHVDFHLYLEPKLFGQTNFEKKESVLILYCIPAQLLYRIKIFV